LLACVCLATANQSHGSAARTTPLAGADRGETVRAERRRTRLIWTAAVDGTLEG